MRPRVSFAPMRRTISLVALFLVATTTVALAQPAGGPNNRRPPPPAPVPVPPPAPVPPPTPAAVWDSRGWIMLGEQPVNGNVDKDRVNVGRYEGKFNKLTVVVLPEARQGWADTLVRFYKLAASSIAWTIL